MTLATCPNQAELVAAEANFCKLSSGVEDTQVIGSCSESEMKWNIITAAQVQPHGHVVESA